MCNYFSCIISRDLKVHWLKTSIKHEDIIKDAGLRDDKLKDRDFVRIEITPINSAIITRDRADWEYKVDEDSTLPNWYTKNQEDCEAACWLAWEESVKINIALDDEVLETKDVFVLASGNAQVKAWDNAQVRAWGNAQVRAWGNAQVRAWGNAQVRASGNAQVRAWGNAQVEASDNAQVRAWGNAQVKARGNAQVEASDNAQVEASGYVTVHKYSTSCIIAVKSKTSVIIDHISDEITVAVGTKIVYQKGD